jgi:outer membrane protein assembly factor BamB
LFVGALSNGIIAIGLSNGEEEWRHETESPVRSSPLVVDDTVVAIDDSGNVSALNIDSGDEQWQSKVGATVNSPAYADGTIYVTDTAGITTAFDSTTGESQQIASFDTQIIASPVVSGSGVVVVSQAGTMKTVSSTEELWASTLDTAIAATPAVGNGTIHVGTENGEAIGLDTTTGDTSWRLSLDGGVQRAPAVAGSIAVYGTDAGMLYGIDTENQEIQWQQDIGSPITTPITVSNGIIYCGAASGQVFAFTASGNLAATLVDELQAGDFEEVQNTITTEVPPTIQGVAGLGIAGTLTYLTAGRWYRNKQNRADAAEGTSPSIPDTLSGDVTPISEESVESSGGLDIEDATYEEFERVEPIGSGGNADVYKARLASDSSEFVALKIPRMADGDTVDADAFSEFIDEAEIWNDIDDHPRIVSVHTWGSNPFPWIAVEYMDSGDLSQQSLTTDEAFAELEGLCEGLHHAHRHGVTHTDIKPENILYTEQGGQSVGKFTDWGLANVLLEHSMSVDGLTPDYSAPEQFRPEEFGGTDEQTDIYQLGVVAYELFTGELPYQISTQAEGMISVLSDDPRRPTEVNPDLSDELDTVLLKALAKPKSQRYETALHFRDDLRRAYDTG